jgi:hypothetical protein
MITKKITFIIGAGAGVDVSMPMGDRLAQDISAMLVVQDENGFSPRVRHNGIASFISRDSAAKAEYLKAAADISDGIYHAKSIDDFLESHLNNNPILKIGKLSIAARILEEEKTSKLFVDPSNIYNSLNNRLLAKSWFSVLAKLMFSGQKPGDLAGAFSNISFINFNYDRCLEQFLTYSISARFIVSPDQSASLVSSLKIFHPYGSLGSIGFPFTIGGLRYGGNQSDDIYQLSQNIRTYSEYSDHNKGELEKIQIALAEAEILVFLGFAFHGPNMKLLKPKQGIAAKKIIGTSIGMSQFDVEDVTASLNDFVTAERQYTSDYPQIALFPIPCADLLLQHQRMLSD